MGWAVHKSEMFCLLYWRQGGLQQTWLYLQGTMFNLQRAGARYCTRWRRAGGRQTWTRGGWSSLHCSVSRRIRIFCIHTRARSPEGSGKQEENKCPVASQSPIPQLRWSSIPDVCCVHPYRTSWQKAPGRCWHSFGQPDNSLKLKRRVFTGCSPYPKTQRGFGWHLVCCWATCILKFDNLDLGRETSIYQMHSVQKYILIRGLMLRKISILISYSLE